MGQFGSVEILLGLQRGTPQQYLADEFSNLFDISPFRSFAFHSCACSSKDVFKDVRTRVENAEESRYRFRSFANTYKSKGAPAQRFIRKVTELQISGIKMN